ncbi:MAG: peptidoglycan-associated outer membrane protein [Bacteroidota bacterium]
MKNLFIAASLGIMSLSTANAQSPVLESTDSLALVTFKVTDFDDVAEAEAIINIDNLENNFTKKAIADVEGKFMILLPEGIPFNITVDKFGKNFNFGKLLIPKADGNTEFEQKLQIKVVTRYLGTYTLENVNFETGKADIKPQAKAALDNLLKQLKESITMKVEIAGHTDNVGDDEKNMTLSQKRADAVKNYLTTRGINPTRIIAKGYGEVKPIADNNTVEGKAKNRRTEVKTIEK